MRSVVLVSGGLDSTVLLAKMVAEGRSVIGFGVDYGQRHVREIESACAVCARLGVEYKLLKLPSLKEIFGANSLTDGSVDVFEGRYEEEGMKNTVVPARNLILISLATAFAISEKCDTVLYAAHSGDHAIYPDCRPKFAKKLDDVVRIADWHEVRLERPFVGMTKAEIVKLGNELSAPMELTWSCYKGGERHCGKCATCLERRAAFAEAKVQDLTEYEG
ncbi:MAG: 7-cyano-7-deazaguanine synthase QueC [Bacteroidales bacterium]|nr:7-cyano-7-deazaguanine synthase QueC [Bacteroidales bacterium]